jgi:hypothetical protein
MYGNSLYIQIFSVLQTCFHSNSFQILISVAKPLHRYFNDPLAICVCEIEENQIFNALYNYHGNTFKYSLTQKYFLSVKKNCFFTTRFLSSTAKLTVQSLTICPQRNLSLTFFHSSITIATEPHTYGNKQRTPCLTSLLTNVCQTMKCIDNL